ncbi:alpha/beta hydrolase fold [Musa troglodytarum]|uniref:Alpha/beta hydrolase fold n=1 Tax=Musa troglodytarum TaxID=320322 RepID=A0A9E7ERD7_9LILI|nr:alpha/beta hydrolase fold [Musa troglodytarum]URD80676.1 alpha/beta hydrolase fold [Musa troglodytarum]
MGNLEGLIQCQSKSTLGTFWHEKTYLGGCLIDAGGQKLEKVTYRNCSEDREPNSQPLQEIPFMDIDYAAQEHITYHCVLKEIQLLLAEVWVEGPKLPFELLSSCIQPGDCLTPKAPNSCAEATAPKEKAAAMAIAQLRTPSSYSPPSATAPLPFTTACCSPSRVPSSAGHWKRVRGLRIASGSGRGLALTLADTSEGLKEIRDCCTIWKWKEFDVNYLVKGKGPPLLLVHGFGASVGHWRRNIGVLSECYTVYALDLLGFGASDKPPGFAYTMEGWAQLILDFLDEVIKKPTVLVGNSVGSLAYLVRGLVLLNCAGGMNNKAVVDDWRIKLLLPLLWLFDFLLSQRVIASALLSVLNKVYGNKDAVDEDLIEIIKGPADDKGALDAFVSLSLALQGQILCL